MVLARWQGTIQDGAGAVVPGASVTITSETTGSLATLYSDRAGTVPITNPMTADSEGFVYFYVIGDAYRITAIMGDESRTFRYVGIGTSSEEDKQLFTIAEATASGAANVIVSGVDEYSRLEIELERVTPITDGEDLTMLVSDDGGSTYLAGTLNLYSLDRRTAATPALSGSTGAAALTLGIDLGNDTGEFYNSTIVFTGHTDTSIYKNIVIDGVQYDNAAVCRAANLRGMVKTFGAITNVAFLMTAGNLNMKIKVKGQI